MQDRRKADHLNALAEESLENEMEKYRRPKDFLDHREQETAKRWFLEFVDFQHNGVDVSHCFNYEANTRNLPIVSLSLGNMLDTTPTPPNRLYLGV